jgi:ATP-dependent Zn protease
MNYQKKKSSEEPDPGMIITISDRMGLVIYERARQPMIIPGNFAQSNTFSEEKSGQIDEEIARFIDEAHQRVKKNYFGAAEGFG